MKKILKWNPGEKLLSIAFFTVLLIILVPVVRLGLYASPYYDDYSYGQYVREAVEAGCGFSGVLSAAFECVKNTYRGWQGTFSSVFLMSLMPAAFGEKYYFLAPLLLIFLLTFSSWFLTGTVAKLILKADKWNRLALQSLSTAMIVTLIYSAQQGFYWYNGGIHYVGGHSFMMLFAACLLYVIYCFKDEKVAKGVIFIILSMLLSVFTAGSNFVTALQGLLVMITIMFLGTFLIKKKAFVYIPVAFTYLFAFYKNVSAPGNSIRAGYYEGEGFPPAEAVLKSFSEGVKWLPKLFGFRTFLFLLLLLPIIWRIVKKTDFKFRFTWIVLILSFCFYATGFTPNLYSTGRIDLARVVNAIKISFQLMLILDEICIAGFIYQHFFKEKEKSWSGLVHWSGYLIWAAAFLLVFSLQGDKAGSYSPYGAYYYVHTGEAACYRNEYLERVSLLESSEEDVVLNPYNFRPWFLCQKIDLSTESDAEINKIVAYYYHKRSVRMAEE